ncbi:MULTISPECIES: TetR/AcrR family transcriptional regulator [unclassified Cryobacterium]|uniref:TetR/AcrR family transcriptional regulator n=1 Tax=unclassified Cryobacterium TaxID=2649013 RepID=UPI0010691E39|nr:MULTISPECIES: TetR/AcrR family transcriptional regulator [unclassified Cryobacterium]MDY7526802.1 TetR/AcrR family transcriptional regulator [Cryobacterium sp. 10C2]MDY7557397.1 TetR/AcrR family transcriptional regulator [Cryobacterium sp. 10C3]MEB0286630.1 TetR/AcrR family transcriptional regulator [Cryobacterium sp. 10S3]MEB0290625.1 TetR/AcrR family transcriptional regulator [Cryobacterium sp. 10C2]MEB0305574.1 TetR/AcrR family transcriptional regulator [Cryobacterium sp. 10I1]
MPKIVDHEERRAEVLEATWRVIATRGLDAATVRQIAKEAGVSSGVLAHYFADKDDILVQAHRLAYDRVFRRVEEKIGRSTGIEALRATLYETLPMDENRRIEAVIDISYIGRALNDPRLKLVRQESAQVARDWWLGVLTSTAAGGHLAVDTNLGLLVDQILVFIDGISLQSVLFPDLMTPELQKQLADDLIARIRA